MKGRDARGADKTTLRFRDAPPSSARQVHSPAARSASCASANSCVTRRRNSSRGHVHDPVLEGHLITVPEVRMSPDLRLATIYVMPLGGARHRRRVAALERNKKFLRGEIARRVNLKFAPDIRFRADERFDEAERIEKLLRTPAVQRDLAPIGRNHDGHRQRSTAMRSRTRRRIFPMPQRRPRRRSNNDPRPASGTNSNSRAATSATCMAGSFSTSRSA